MTFYALYKHFLADSNWNGAVCNEIQSRAAVEGDEGGAAAGNRQRILHKMGCQVFRAEVVHTTTSSCESPS